MGQLKNLWFVLVLAGTVLFAPQPARAQSNMTCSSTSGNLQIPAEAILDCLRAGKSVNFDGITVEGDLDLTSLYADPQGGITLPGALVIRSSQFNGSLVAYGYKWNDEAVLTFKSQVDLRGSQFKEGVDFTGATFKEFAHFENTHFESNATFTQTAFQNGAHFRGAVFDHYTSFLGAQIFGGMDFSEAQFLELSVFSYLRSFQAQDPMFQADISFAGARFNGAVHFVETSIENTTLFNDAVFQRSSPDDAVLFTNSTFSTIDLTDARFETGQLDLSGQHLDNLIMPNFHPSILTPQNTGESLVELKINFLKQGDLDTANNISYWQNVIRREGDPLPSQILETIFLDWTFGYGYRPLNAAIVSLILILFFAFFYYPAGTLRPTEFAPSKPRDWKIAIRLTEIPIAPEDRPSDAEHKNHGRHPLPPEFIQAWEAIAFSLGVFTKLSTGKYVAVRAGSLVIAEWAIGLIFMAGFLFSLANTNPLLRSILDLFK